MNNLMRSNKKAKIDRSSAVYKKGKWTTLEEEYAKEIILGFKSGEISLPKCDSKTTLRCYIAKRLRCDPMRVSKKFAGLAGLGLRFRPPAEDVSYKKKEEYSSRLAVYEALLSSSIESENECASTGKKRKAEDISQSDSQSTDDDSGDESVIDEVYELLEQWDDTCQEGLQYLVEEDNFSSDFDMDDDEWLRLFVEEWS
mmetsp:Transcript_9094/g.9148  ORF Transcript_9094/g.9148 Transcript_9094/m.9148 type:complete len:199 (+) Transcript_9094:111-707(+)|eukprot:CAMPEP_0182427248 /NCGR_PEP_ID=MMETSP1167-20130531/16286_1 /TAXON_ID=2988 /ORGANISM="Mallomonas Sp, Strain CCMP3275" /LENGTH=198 /DNA_ID=CAMNT_0024609355 /DNA_START=85 /DNA_END=681 /DNA_ORIENTATION=+